MGGVHLPVLLVSGAVLGLVLTLRYLAPKVPGPLVAVVGVTVASAFWRFFMHGIPSIGAVAGGLPHPNLQLLPWRGAHNGEYCSGRRVETGILLAMALSLVRIVR